MATFKFGEQDEVRDGRLFTNYTEAAIQELVAKVGGFDVLRIWTTQDIRPDVSRLDWVNILLRKQS